jgi:hypothetical protein
VVSMLSCHDCLFVEFSVFYSSILLTRKGHFGEFTSNDNSLLERKGESEPEINKNKNKNKINK